MRRYGRRKIFTEATAIVYVLAFLILLVYVELLPPLTKWVPSTYSHVSSVFSSFDSRAINDDDPPIFKHGKVFNDTFMIFNVYWDRRPRNSTPELMVLAVSRCRNETRDQPYAVFKDSADRVAHVMQLKGVHMENNEELWGCVLDTHCFFGPRQFFKPVSSILSTQFQASDDADKYTEVMLYAAEGRTLAVRPIWSPAKYDDALAVCIPPFYWYHDWRRILIFMAIWRAQGASHFYFYLNSCTKDVYKLLKYYEKQGYGTIVSYPDLPVSEELDPNWTTYRLAHALAINDCALRTKSRWAAHVDIDEIILMNDTNVRIIDWLKEQPDDVAGWSFQHHDLFFSERLMEDLLNPNAKISPIELEDALYYRSKRRPPKVIFQSKGVRSDSVHNVYRVQSGFRNVEVNTTDAWYGHFRWNLNLTEALENNTALPMMTHDQAKQVAKYIEQMRSDVFGKYLPKYNGSAIDHTTNGCSENWWAQEHACMVPMRTCVEDMMPLADWHFERTTDQVYTVL